ncbi:MAG: bifunctional adenosylcobinamide kinase/adenosylcobinamide-phosphate guanylyltransferase [Rhodobacteraceae bacterium]|nr:bifunctional adenosylcobinamide kinase/adenosylcobinamide-phosphate guanylyltransferase [Paracoccaceae bacterium]
MTLVLGGAASGKSRFAEGLIKARPPPWIYVATARASDAEMTLKIKQHQQGRGPGWITLEAPTDLPAALKSVPSDALILIDCLTLWLANIFLQKSDVDRLTHTFMTVAGECKNPIVAVSNEVGHGIVPDNRPGRDFRVAQGILNQRVAAQADLVVFVTAGLPRVLKGTLP